MTRNLSLDEEEIPRFARDDRTPELRGYSGIGPWKSGTGVGVGSGGGGPSMIRSPPFNCLQSF